MAASDRGSATKRAGKPGENTSLSESPKAAITWAVDAKAPSKDAWERALRFAAMSVTHTLGPDTALASNAGYRAAMCQAYGAPGRTITTDPLKLAFRAQVGPCGESPPAGPLTAASR